MLNKKNFFNKFIFNSKIFNYNLKKTKNAFISLRSDINNSDIPLLLSFQKNYEYDFSSATVKKFLKYENIIIIGMGGSILGTKSIYSFLKKKIKKKIFFFDNLDSNLHMQFRKIKNLKNSCYIVVSKSGNTLETLTNLEIIFSKKLLINKLIIITEIKNNSLMSVASKCNAEIIEHKEYIGGRYSVLSEVGMFPAALMGLDIEKFKNLKMLIKNKNFVSALIHNVASIYTLNFMGKNNSVMINYDSNLNDLGYWYQQLVGESLGKKGKGINPTLSVGPRDHHNLLQLYLDGPRDKFFTFFSSSTKNDKKIETIVNAQSKAVKNIFEKKRIPYRQFIFKKNDESELGKIFTFFVLETILLSSLMNVNPYDQPAVEEVKIETKKFLR